MIWLAIATLSLVFLGVVTCAWLIRYAFAEARLAAEDLKGLKAEWLQTNGWMRADIKAMSEQYNTTTRADILAVRKDVTDGLALLAAGIPFLHVASLESESVRKVLAIEIGDIANELRQSGRTEAMLLALSERLARMAQRFMKPPK